VIRLYHRTTEESFNVADGLGINTVANVYPSKLKSIYGTYFCKYLLR
jgi:hypothetical protein